MDGDFEDMATKVRNILVIDATVIDRMPAFLVPYMLGQNNDEAVHFKTIPLKDVIQNTVAPALSGMGWDVVWMSHDVFNHPNFNQWWAKNLAFRVSDKTMIVIGGE